MSALYNLYISGIQPERTHQAESIIEAFSGQFSNRTEKLIELLKNPRESCFFANITNQQAQDLQYTLSIMGLICKYCPSTTKDESELKLAPLEQEVISCPSCNNQQKRTESQTQYQCLSCGKKWTFVERRKNVKGQRQFCNSNLKRTTTQAPESNPSINKETEKQSVVKRAEIATRENRRTRFVYQNIFIFTVLSIIFIGMFAIWQTSHKPFIDSETLVVDSSNQRTFKRVLTNSNQENQNNNTLFTSVERNSPTSIIRPFFDTINNVHPNLANNTKTSLPSLPGFQLQKELQLDQNQRLLAIQSLFEIEIVQHQHLKSKALIKENELKNLLQIDTLVKSIKNITADSTSMLTIKFIHQMPNREKSLIYQNAFKIDKIATLGTGSSQLNALFPENLHIDSSNLLTIQTHDIQFIRNQIAITPNKFNAVVEPHQTDLFKVIYEMEKNYLAHKSTDEKKNFHIATPILKANNSNLYSSPVQRNNKIQWPTFMNLILQTNVSQKSPNVLEQGIQVLQCVPKERFRKSITSHSFSSMQMVYRNQTI